jgi:hypothetical protein
MFKWQEYIFGKWGVSKKLKPEDHECALLCNELRKLVLNNKFNGLFLHIENELNKSPSAQYSLLKKITGKIPGSPDYLFLRDGYGMFIEMKAGKGKQSESQKMFQEWCDHNNVNYYVCYSSIKAFELVKKSGFIKE